jgi:hypothetical protein
MPSCLLSSNTVVTPSHQAPAMTTTVAYHSDQALAQAGLLSCDGNLIDRFMRRFAKGVNV